MAAARLQLVSLVDPPLDVWNHEPYGLGWLN